ncbi:MAG: DNA repair and recombination protein RadA [Candidatus Thorarchaeota archaeon]|nr:MAG: DNA repair and recombination protein RadA [Candidatus Thorarchaeota archaeon]
MTELEAVSGVGPAASKRLREVLVTTAELLAVQNPVELATKTKLGEGTTLKIIRSARQLVGLCGFKSGLEVEQEMASKPRLSSGLKEMNRQMFGGIECGSIVEFYGPARGGKTQWCCQLAVVAQLPREKGGLEGRILWLDTENSFKPWVIRANAVRFGLDPDVALGNIGLAHIVISEQITDVFESIPQLCAEQDYKLVVIDSLTGLFRAEYKGLNALTTRQQTMNQLLNQMRRIAAATNAVFVYTNQVMSTVSIYGGNPNAPAGGHVISHASDYRFYTRRKSGVVRLVELQDNAGIPEFKVEVMMGWGGFYMDTDEKKETESRILDYFKMRGWSAQSGEEEQAASEKSARKKRKKAAHAEKESEGDVKEEVDEEEEQ